MMTRKILLTGPAGSGKTFSILQDFEQTLRESRDPLAEDFFLVLPSAEHTERMITLILQRNIKGFFHRRVTTLSRLISTLFAVGDEGVATNVTRYLLLRDHLSSAPREYFQEVQQTPGFLNLLLGFVTELKESLIPPDLFRERMNALKRLEPELSSKYEALAGLYEHYEKELKSRGLRDRQDALSVYRERQKGQPPRKNRIRKVWLDGFFDFSELQSAYLEELCAASDEVVITLTMDSDPSRADLFDIARRTESMLLQMGFEKQELARRSDETFPASLAVVEKHLFQSPRPVSPPGRPAKDITVFEAVGVEGEVEMIARTIEHLQRQGKFRFSDFAILLRNIGEYETVIRSVFSRYGIPVEVHEREKLSFAPMMPVVSALLRIFRDGWKLQDLMTFLKSGYVRSLGEEANTYEWASELEHGALRRKVLEGREAWLEAWGEGASEEMRARKLGVIASVEDRLRGARSFAQQKAIFREAVERTFRIFEIQDSSEEHVRRDAASHRRFVSLLDEIEISSKGEALEPGLLAERFFRLLELDLYSLHDHDRNRVQVYNVSLARQKEYQVVFVAGLLEKKFPVQIKEDPLLSDWERKLFNGQGGRFHLKERLPSQSLERYLFYVAVTRARHKLILTYPRLDLEGKESLPSFYVDEVKALFDGPLPERKQRLSQPFPGFEDAVSSRELEMALMGGLWDPLKTGSGAEPLLLETAACLLEREDSRDRLGRAFFEVQDELTDPEILKKDVFKPWQTSSTALEEYAKCAFKYYAHRVLRLDDPEEDKNVTNRGNILHEVLELAFKTWIEQPEILSSPQLAVQEALKLLEKALLNYPILSARRYQYELEISDLRETLVRFLEEELARLSESPLKPAYFELGFGTQGAQHPALVIPVNGKEVNIRGKIDRIDLDADRSAGLILDYKRSAVFSRSALELGTLLQLPIYSLVLERILKIQPAGAELYSLRNREKKGFYRSSRKDLFPGLSSRSMVLEEKEFGLVLARAEAFIAKFTRERALHKMEAKPRDILGCRKFCSYSAVCRIHKWKLEMIAEEIKASDAKEMPDFFARAAAVAEAESGVSE